MLALVPREVPLLTRRTTSGLLIALLCARCTAEKEGFRCFKTDPRTGTGIQIHPVINMDGIATFDSGNLGVLF